MTFWKICHRELLSWSCVRVLYSKTIDTQSNASSVHVAATVLSDSLAAIAAASRPTWCSQCNAAFSPIIAKEMNIFNHAFVGMQESASLWLSSVLKRTFIDIIIVQNVFKSERASSEGRRGSCIHESNCPECIIKRINAETSVVGDGGCGGTAVVVLALGAMYSNKSVLLTTLLFPFPGGSINMDGGIFPQLPSIIAALRISPIMLKFTQQRSKGFTQSFN
mmetsp:Transcript_95938/g.188380  ORF Transcript_95938/g.188380 Transcript_95938/m.188380 type:complete len:221 (-) Transcript_95938:365-1027(-)